MQLSGVINCPDQLPMLGVELTQQGESLNSVLRNVALLMVGVDSPDCFREVIIEIPILTKRSPEADVSYARVG